MQAAPTPRIFPDAGADPGPILLVEDDGLIRSALAGCLEDRGYEVLPLEEAETAIELIGRGMLPRVVITDLGLGAGGDGAELADEVHRLSPASHVVFITGQQERLGERGLKARETVLAKPFRFETLIEMLGSIDAPPPATVQPS